MNATYRYIAVTLVSVLFIFSGIIFTGMNDNINKNRIDIDKLTVEKMDKSEISSRLDRIEGYLIIVSQKSSANDLYIERLSCDLGELKLMFKEYVLDKK